MPQAQKVESSNDVIVELVKTKISEKDAVIKEQMLQLADKDQQIGEKDGLIQELQERISDLEQASKEREDLISRLNEVLE